MSDGRKDDQAKQIRVENVADELASDIKNVLVFMGARYNPNTYKQRIDVVWQKDLLASLDMNQKALLLDALQKAAEYVAASIGPAQGSSGVA